MSELTDFVNGIIQRGLSHIIHRYYGLCRAVVMSNQDPLGLGRVQISCATVGHTETAYPMWWALPAMEGAGAGRGSFFPPEAGDTVWVNFREGDPSIPEVYLGGWFGMSTGPTASGSDVPTFLQPPSSNFPEKKGFVTRAGHALIFNDTVGGESVTMVFNKPGSSDPSLTNRAVTATYNTGVPAPSPAFQGQTLGAHVLNMDANGFLLKTASSFILQLDESKGAITLAAPNGSMVSITPTGNIQLIHTSGSSIAMSGSAVTISALATQPVNISGQSISLNGGALNLGSKASDFAVLGLKLIAWLAKHTHPYSFGTTLPPLPPPTPADFLSMTVKVQP
jgi:Type VI secretion system/phage-baseplate injector OB domain